MIETLVSIQVGIELFSLSILFFIATKLAVLNHNTTEIKETIKWYMRQE